MGFISRPFTTKSSIWAPYLNDQQVLRSSTKGANYELCWTPVLMSVIGMKSQRLQLALSCRYYFPFNILILQETFRNALNPSFILVSFDILTLQETLIFALQRNVDWRRQHIIPNQMTLIKKSRHQLTQASLILSPVASTVTIRRPTWPAW